MTENRSDEIDIAGLLIEIRAIGAAELVGRDRL